MRNEQQGFTLIELMIAVAVVGILAVIAYPSYRSQILRSHRAEAKSALLQVQVAQEKYALQNNTYATTDTLLAALPTASSNPGLGISTTSTAGYYTISLGTGGTATTYTATATVTAKQSDDTNCKTFTIDQSGSRGSTNSSNANSTGCW